MIGSKLADVFVQRCNVNKYDLLNVKCYIEIVSFLFCIFFGYLIILLSNRYFKKIFITFLHTFL